MVKIINLTQHPATQEQKDAGAFDVTNRKELQELLTFEDLPTEANIRLRAKKIAALATQECASVKFAMIGGAPYLMSALERSLKNLGIKPLYAFSLRKSVETVNADGGVRKTAVFKHIDFIEV